MQVNPVSRADIRSGKPNSRAVFDDWIILRDGAKGYFVARGCVLLGSYRQVVTFTTVCKKIPGSDVFKQGRHVVVVMNLKKYMFGVHRIP